MAAWFMEKIRWLFFAFDSVIYSFIDFLYELLLYLANINLFGASEASGSDMLAQLTSRIYILLGIFMLFKVSFSILQYIVDPDSFSDKSKGFGKLITNVIVVLVLLVFTPMIFRFAYDVQSVVLNNNIIPKLILGNSTGNEIEDDTVEGMGPLGMQQVSRNSVLAKDIEFLVFGSFATINPVLIESCENSPVLGTKAMAKAETSCLDDVNAFITDRTDVSIGDFFRTSNEEDHRNFDSFGRIVGEHEGDDFYLNYQFGISTIAGAFVVVMMLSYCIAVGVRIMKLFFLQLIAPIPIVSYIDPKQSKDGTLFKWAKECGKTYVSLFIHLIIIFLSFYLIDLIVSSVLSADIYYDQGDNKPQGIMSVFVMVILILSVLIFANQVPKLLENLFGFKSSGDFTINPLKRVKESPLASMAVGGTIGAGQSAAANAANLYYKIKKLRGTEKYLGATSNKEKAKMIGNELWRKRGTVTGGLISGAIHGARNSAKGDVFAGANKAREKSIANREAREKSKKQDVSTRVSNKVTQFAGTKNAFGTVGAYDEKIKNLQEQMEQWNRMQRRATERLEELIPDGQSELKKVFIEYDGKMSENDLYQKYLSENKNSITVDRGAFNNLFAIQSDITNSQKEEAALKKQISELQDASGIKPKDK